MRMVQACGYLCFHFETLELMWIKNRHEGQHLQSYTPPQGQLLRFIDHPHAPTSDFP